MAYTEAPITTQTDEALMLLYQQGESAAFDALFERHAPRVLGFLIKQIGSAEAEDLLQSVFLKLHLHRDRYLSEYPFLPWLFTITRNSVTDYFRKRKSIPMEATELERRLPSVTDEPNAEIDEGRRLEQILAGLPKDQRELLQLRIQNNLSFEEISHRLGTNAPTVRKRLSRLIQKLRLRELGDYETNELAT